MKMKKTILKKIIIVVSVIFILVWLIWGNISVKLTNIEIDCDNLPNSFSGFKIAHISDFHNAEFGDDNEKIIELIKNSMPDMIAITGDLIDSEHIDISIVREFIANIVDIAPCYYVTGNHEAWIGSEYSKLEDILIEAGVVVLHNEMATFEINEQKINIIGLDDPDFNDDAYKYSSNQALILSKLEYIGDIEGFTILLSHRPELYDVYVKSGIDLVLSGHAHGGQVRIPLIGGLVAPNQGFFPKYDSGVYIESDTSMVVSCGIGNSVIPIRINNRPEVVIVELKTE